MDEHTWCDGKVWEYRTAEIAGLVGVHPNTVRFYEAQGLLPTVPRRVNGYRVYTRRHLLHLQLIRTALRVEILSDNLRLEAIGVLKTAASGVIADARRQTEVYMEHIEQERARAQAAVDIAKRLLRGGPVESHVPVMMGRRAAAAHLGVTMDVLRDWERNGLLCVPRKGGRRQYGPGELERLEMIRVLRNAHYSQMAIRRMLAKLDRGERDLLRAIDTPDAAEDLVHVTDRYISSLGEAACQAQDMLHLLEHIRAESEG